MSEARGWYPRRSMARKNSPKSHAGDVSGKGPLKDPWGAFGYLVSGVAVYGLIGWASTSGWTRPSWWPSESSRGQGWAST